MKKNGGLARNILFYRPVWGESLGARLCGATFTGSIWGVYIHGALYTEISQGDRIFQGWIQDSESGVWVTVNY